MHTRSLTLHLRLGSFQPDSLRATFTPARYPAIILSVTASWSARRSGNFPTTSLAYADDPVIHEGIRRFSAASRDDGTRHGLGNSATGLGGGLDDEVHLEGVMIAG